MSEREPCIHCRWNKPTHPPFFCEWCGRDLRLPFPRKWDASEVDTQNTEMKERQWWWVCLDSGSKCLVQIEQVETLWGEKVWSIRDGLRLIWIYQSYDYVFGPVTVSPEVPE